MENYRATPEHETLGDLFRKLRMEKSLDVADVALETRIPPETIRAMEADDYSRLPARAFARGFYSLYAKMLGLDPDEVLLRFTEESSPDDLDENEDRSYAQSRRDKNISSMAERPSQTTGSIISFSLLIILLVAAGISWYAGYNPAKQISNWLRGFQQTPVLEEVQEQIPELLQNTNPVEQLTEQERALPELSAQPVLAEAKYQLVAEFQEPVEVAISLDGAEPEQLSFPGGRIESWQAEEHIVLELPRDAAVRLYLNGIVVPLPPAVEDKIIVSIPEYFLD